MSLDEAAAALLDPAAYADGRLEAACSVLRSESPVHWVETPEFRPFFALTRHKDVHHVETAGDLFQAGPRYRLFRAVDDPRPGEGVSTLVRLDPPEHTRHRALVAFWFHPRHLRTLEDSIAALAKASVDAMAERSEPYDFVADVSMQLPLTVISSLLGIPAEDRGLIMRLTQQAFGTEDPEYRKLASDLDPAEAALDFAGYFAGVVQDRLDSPRDDLSSVLAHAELDGEPLPPSELVAYFGILATAGHDTTSSAIAGGLHALIERPDQLEKLRADPLLVATAVEEMIRWVTPVKSFMRVAADDTEISGQPIAKGEAVLLVYPSANRDEEVFVAPDEFDVGRSPNNHLAFGHGAHFCLGAQLARMESRAFFAELLPRLRNVELAGEPELVKTLFVGGLKHLPIRAEVA